MTQQRPYGLRALSHRLGTTVDGVRFDAWVDEDRIVNTGQAGYEAHASDGRTTYQVVHDPRQGWLVMRDELFLVADCDSENEALRIAATCITRHECTPG